MGFTIFAIVIIVASLAGLLFKKNGELSGLGRDHKRGGLRAPHGKLVRTKRLDGIEDLSFKSRLGIVFAIVAGLTILVVGLCLIGILEFGGALAVCVHFVLVIGTSIAVAQADVGLWRACAFAVGGYLLLAALLSIAWVAGVPFVSTLSAPVVNMLTIVFGAIGAAFGIAWMPAVRTYAREFEDGHVNTIQISANAAAVKAYDQLLDNSWKPPADRIAHPEYENPRSRRGDA